MEVVGVYIILGTFAVIILIGIISGISVILDMQFKNTQKKWKCEFNNIVYGKLENGLLTSQSYVQTLFRAFVSDKEKNFRFPLSLAVSNN